MAVACLLIGRIGDRIAAVFASRAHAAGGVEQDGADVHVDDETVRDSSLRDLPLRIRRIGQVVRVVKMRACVGHSLDTLEVAREIATRFTLLVMPAATTRFVTTPR